LLAVVVAVPVPGVIDVILLDFELVFAGLFAHPDFLVGVLDVLPTNISVGTVAVAVQLLRVHARVSALDVE